jgi:hypothetical protein
VPGVAHGQTKTRATPNGASCAASKPRRCWPDTPVEMQLDDSRVLLSPTDLANHLARAHLAALEIALVCGERQRPLRENPQAELIRRKGDEHELAYLARLKVDAGGRAFQPSRLERLSHLGRRSVTRARGRRTGPSCRAAGRDSSWISVAEVSPGSRGRSSNAARPFPLPATNTPRQANLPTVSVRRGR